MKKIYEKKNEDMEKEAWGKTMKIKVSKREWKKIQGKNENEKQ